MREASLGPTGAHLDRDPERKEGWARPGAASGGRESCDSETRPYRRLATQHQAARVRGRRLAERRGAGDGTRPIPSCRSRPLPHLARTRPVATPPAHRPPPSPTASPPLPHPELWLDATRGRWPVSSLPSLPGPPPAPPPLPFPRFSTPRPQPERRLCTQCPDSVLLG